MSSLVKLFQKVTISPLGSVGGVTAAKSLGATPGLSAMQMQVRHRSKPNVMMKPAPGVFGKSYRRIVHFQDKYTVEPLNTTHMAGRDPVSGRVVAKGIGGGIRFKYRWIKWTRDGPESGPPKEERVLEILEDGCRTGHVALVGSGDELKYIIATENMKPGDIIRTSREVTRIPVRANEGDSFPLGSLPNGIKVCDVEKFAGTGGFYCHSAGTCATILRRENGRVILLMPSKHEFSFDPKCLARVGRISNVLHGDTPIGSAQRNRWLGNRPRSGLWRRKDGRHGRKIKPMRHILAESRHKNLTPKVHLTMHID